MVGSEYRKERTQKTLCWANLMEQGSHMWENIVKLDVKEKVMWNGLTENPTT
jgi:hypothetical protein